MKLAIIGTGYVGLVTGTCFAEMGNEVFCVDVDEEKLERLRSGDMPLYEPGLVVLYERSLRERRLHFTSNLDEAIPSAEIVFLTLPTPQDEDGSADLSYVISAAEAIAKRLRGYTVIVSKSTVPVGTCEILTRLIDEHTPDDAEFDVVSNPEFLREGVAVDDFMKPDRVVIGSSSRRATEILTTVYEPFVRSGNPILVMDERSAELTKYAANAFLASRISFMNEIANLCDRLGADVDSIRRGLGTDARIGPQFLYAGIGYGGSCFPKDVSALEQIAASVGYDFQILKAVSNVNQLQREQLAARIINHFDGDLTGKRVAVWGLAFKANTDDIREAPSLSVIDRLLETGADVVVFDPEAMENVHRVMGDRIEYAPDLYEALEDADALVICTEWNEFRRPDFGQMKQLMTQPTIFDGRNLFKPREAAAHGLHYESVGRPKIEQSLTESER